tara:strand:- start:1947 stop:2222 length:276 start_codon:yes stop_codon:yes gene_type:complete
MPEGQNIKDIIDNAIGDKPLSVEKAMQNAMVAQAAHIISGKRGELEQSLSADKAEEDNTPVEKEEEDDEIDDVTDDELDDMIANTKDESEE